MTRPAPMFNDNKLKLGIFSANCSSGMAVTKVEERWVNDWPNNIELVKQCDAAGIEFMLPIARWIGYGETPTFTEMCGDSDLGGGTRCALQNIQVFATVRPSITRLSQRNNLQP